MNNGAAHHEQRTEIAALRDRVRALKVSYAIDCDSATVFRQMFDLAPYGMAISDADTRYSRVNRALCGMLGYTQEELLGRTWLEITHPDDRAASLNCRSLCLAGELHAFTMAKRYVTAAGVALWALVTVWPVSEERPADEREFVSLVVTRAHVIEAFGDVDAIAEARRRGDLSVGVYRDGC